MEESVSLDMDNHMLDKEEGCYDNTEAAFSDDEEEVNNKGEEKTDAKLVWTSLTALNQFSPEWYSSEVNRTQQKQYHEGQWTFNGLTVKEEP